MNCVGGTLPVNFLRFDTIDGIFRHLHSSQTGRRELIATRLFHRGLLHLEKGAINFVFALQIATLTKQNRREGELSNVFILGGG